MQQTDFPTQAEETDFSSQVKKILKPIERRGQVVNSVLAILLGAVLVWALIANWRSSQLPKIESITIDSVSVIGSSDLCPGETLTLAYQASIEGYGVVMWDDSVLHNDQPVTFSDTKRFTVDGPVTLKLRDVWRVPVTPDTSASELPAWLPGSYWRYITISAPATFTSRYTPPGRLKVPFKIRKGCTS